MKLSTFFSLLLLAQQFDASYSFQASSSFSPLVRRVKSGHATNVEATATTTTTTTPFHHRHVPSTVRGVASSTSSTSSLKASTSSSSSSNEVLDVEAIAKYAGAATIQLSLISAAFYGLDTILATTSSLSSLPSPITWFICYVLSLKSRVFNPLNNARPDRQKAVSEEKSAGFNDRIQPSWTPPGVVFPIMWILIIGPLRATSSTMIVNAMGGEYFTLPLMSLMLHLTCGDIWNTINNTERRFGTSVLGISCVYFSALHAAWQYYQVDPLAGKLLGATAIWLTIASSLIIQTWRLNVNDNGEKESLLPLRIEGEESKTQFKWF